MRDYPRRRQNDEARAAWLRMIPAERRERRADRLDRQRRLTLGERAENIRRRALFRDNEARQWLSRELPRALGVFTGGKVTQGIIEQMQAIVGELVREAERRFRYVPQVSADYNYERRTFEIAFRDTF